ncbi:dTMP kinase [candidate division WOR-1 bacterium RIFOXYA2_FULL_36_21]|uniref:Thymidylate kinase n=1 Tax=candidate division WOR-1 bacterium RIFOXYB2_FULL_36_35 TaxID=1802578 RepID=A0A1F4S4D9_UNCSA|nr:MAG: dTMP kinase [candidate division WOR-1 bacterium RIFOXYA2_FULL_36_21]OGC14264.1 MAG: dTMP kinase [candidate division WOR-1 bacterium RIFOXYA12_FULL_36_13]OGC15269.1 MAG: dTMP kinase [candidate division WOR-1 bacterium RIFOXYB2_FULL_36_35]
MFITFEGCEGSGKSTQIKLLEDYIKSIGKEVIITKEPGGSNLGEEIRKILFNYESEILAEIFMFAADRVEHVEKVIKPALANGKVVLCDRYIDSTLAYQLGGRGLPEDLVRYINWISSRGIIPDLTILLDIPAKKGLERAKKRGAVNRFENEILAFHERVREKYEELEENDQKRIKKINAQMPIEEVAEKIKLLVTEIIK